jgi:diguanylate cyclase (GGDEF)-like protein
MASDNWLKKMIKGDPYDLSNYRLSASLPAVRAFVVIIGIFNLALLIPDMINLKGSALALDFAMRLLFTAVCAVLYYRLRRFRTFKALAAAITAAELLAVAVFLAVFSLYDSPDFMIQLLGIMLIIFVVFMVPNRIFLALIVSVLAAAGFLVVAYGAFTATDSVRYFASAVYIAIEIMFGAVFMLIFLNYQRREYTANKELQKLYATDPLTQVGNRVRLEKEAYKWLAFCSRHSLPLSLVIIDVDDMKRVNDLHGHLMGDATICELVHTVCGHLRRNDVCVRWGGDEFVLLLPGTGTADALYLIERIRCEVEAHAFPAETRITCSFGVADTRRSVTLEELLECADQSLYQAKKQGKNAACSADIAPEASSMIKS